MRLTPKRQAFVEHYLGHWNATEAARRAGYRHPNKLGSRVANLGVVRALIAERLQEHALTADEVLARLAQIARGEHAAYLRPDGSVDLAQMKEDGKLHLIKSVRPTRYGLVVEFYDAQAALVHIGKHLGLFTERVELRGGLNLSPDDAAEAVELVRQYRERMKANASDAGNG